MDVGRKFELLRHYTAHTAALLAGTIACGMAKPPEAAAHVPLDQSPAALTGLGAFALGPDLSPVLTGKADIESVAAPVKAYASVSPSNLKAGDETRKVTMADIDKYRHLSSKYIRENYIATPEAPHPPCVGKESYTFLPAHDPARDAVIGTPHDTYSDMRTMLRDGTWVTNQDGVRYMLNDGTWVNAAGRANPGCKVELLDKTRVGPEGDNDICKIKIHEDYHYGFTSKEPGRNPYGQYPESDLAHDLNPKSLMSVQGPARNARPCVNVTIDRVRHSPRDLANDSIEYIPTLRKDLEADAVVECGPYTPSKKLFFCFSTIKNKEVHGHIIRFTSRYTKDGKPQFKYKKMSDPALEKYLKRDS